MAGGRKRCHCPDRGERCVSPKGHFCGQPGGLEQVTSGTERVYRVRTSHLLMSRLIGTFFTLRVMFHRWGQIQILSSLAEYRAVDTKEAEYICERVLPRLQHANGGVVLAAIKVCRLSNWK